MTTITKMRQELLSAHQEGLVDEVHLISEVEGAPKDAIEVVICYLALDAARGSYDALVACEAIKKWVRG